MNNLQYIREIAKIPKKIISDLLNVSVYTYTGYEQGRLLIPFENVIIIKRIYNINIKELYCDINDISITTKNELMIFSKLSNQEKKERLIYNLVKKHKNGLTYRQINKIKDAIRDSKSSKEQKLFSQEGGS